MGTRTPEGGVILDLGCGDGIPVARALVEEGCGVYGVDASGTMTELFKQRVPEAQVACEAVEESSFFKLDFDGAIAWGLLFLLAPESQLALISRVSSVLKPQGSFLFTAPAQECSWIDVLTGGESVSLGRARYRAALEAAGLALVGEYQDDGANHYLEALKL